MPRLLPISTGWLLLAFAACTHTAAHDSSALAARVSALEADRTQLQQRLDAIPPTRARFVKYSEPSDGEWNGWGTFFQLRAYTGSQR
ncbi:MAG TPA: hypothetical protein VEU33_16290 [Archangium sp.]|nr:hypothetical protein [Archangium sp.]